MLMNASEKELLRLYSSCFGKGSYCWLIERYLELKPTTLSKLSLKHLLNFSLEWT